MGNNILTEKAGIVYKENFNNITWFGRCIFLSWYCDKGTCAFCFRSTVKHKIKHASSAKRSIASILTDAIIGKALGWRLEFLTGGYGIFSFEEMLEIVKKVSVIYGEKIWINLGLADRKQLEKLRPYVEGVCASIETVEAGLHDRICPDKPIGPYSEMLKLADSMGFKKSATIVIGLGEKKEDFELLADFIEGHKLDRITFYALKPVKGTEYTKSPEPQEYAWWIANTRIRFPKLEIIAGLTPKRAEEYAGLILKSGANALTKFPAVKKFGTLQAAEVERQIIESGRMLAGSLTQLSDTQLSDSYWNERIMQLPFEEELKKRIWEKTSQYIFKMKEQSKQNGF
jgi:biotin synthase-like enzyme